VKSTLLIAVLTLTTTQSVMSQAYAPGDHWYNNPLGFSPVELHAKNGFIVPALAVTACLLLTKRDSALADRISYYDEAGVSWGYKIPYTTLYQDNAGLMYMLRKWMAIGLEISSYFPRDDFNSTAGVGVRPFARFYPVSGDRFKIYFESGAGIIYFFNNFPEATYADSRTGTLWNGTSKYGIGFEIRVGGSTEIVTGVRHIHVSNGNIAGVLRNPSHDSNGIFVGIDFTPKKRESTP